MFKFKWMVWQQGDLVLTCVCSLSVASYHSPNVLNITINLLAGLIRLRQELRCITNPDLPISTLHHVKFHFRESFTGMRKGINANEPYVFNEVQVARWGTRWRSWLRQCTISRKVAGSFVFDVVIGIFR
jgi:hypothetical protein